MGDYYVFVDVDCEIKPNALTEVASFLTQNPSIGGLQMKLIRARDNRIDSVGTFLSFIGYPYELGSGYPASSFSHPRPILGAKTAGFAIRRHVFETIGGFDERYLVHGEDVVVFHEQLVYSVWRYFRSSKWIQFI